MELGKFYFLLDKYFIDFNDPNLMKNKEEIGGLLHDRPCYYSFFEDITGIYWMIPFSSKIEKYEHERNKKIERNGECETIIFGEVLGFRKVFLIQNMCPVIPEYIKNEYRDKNGNEVRIGGEFQIKLVQSAKKILALQRKCQSSFRYIFPDVLSIEERLIIKLLNQSNNNALS
jgi:hypothetical protein